MTLALVLAAAATAALGVGLVVIAVAPRRRSLVAELDELLGTETVPVTAAVDFWGTLGDAFSSVLAGTAARDGARFGSLVSDMAATDETPAALTRQIATIAALFAALAVAVVAVFAVEGLHVARTVDVVLVALAGSLGAAVPRVTLRSQAAERRAEMREAVAVICDLAAVLVAAGEDIDGAVMVAAGAGEGWAFEAVRASLPVNGRLGTWVALEGLGQRLGVEELVVLAQNMGLAEEKGAKIREALNTQAKTLREEAASEVEAKAGSMTERMSFPMVMLLAGFLLVIGYPAVTKL